MADGDLTEISELYKIGLSVFPMDVANTVRPAITSKQDLQAPLPSPLCIELMCSQEDSQSLVPAGEWFPLTYLSSLNLFFLCPWRLLFSLQLKPQEEIKQVWVCKPQKLFFSGNIFGWQTPDSVFSKAVEQVGLSDHPQVFGWHLL